jgi:hypothetical protein
MNCQKFLQKTRKKGRQKNCQPLFRKVILKFIMFPARFQLKNLKPKTRAASVKALQVIALKAQLFDKESLLRAENLEFHEKSG